MANPKSSGSGPGVEDARPPASVSSDSAAAPASAIPGGQVTAPPTLDDLSAGVERLAALIAFMRGSAAVVAGAQAAPAASAASAAEVKDDDGDEDDKDEDDDLDVDDEASDDDDPEWRDPPLKNLIERERSRLDLASSILAGVDADLFSEDLNEGHLKAQRVSPGYHQDVICLVRRMLRKTVNKFDSIYVGPMVKQAVAAALEVREAQGDAEYDPYGDTPQMAARKRAVAERLAASEGRSASGS
jgi:hypothetical protein